MCCARCYTDVLRSMLHRCVVPDVVPDVLRSMLHRCVVPDVVSDVLCPMLHRCVVPDVASDVLYSMCCARFTPVCVEGRCPYFDILPLQGANVIKPSRGGGPRVSFTPFTIPWAEIPLPLQGAAVSKPPNNYGALVFLNRAPRFQNLRIITGRWCS